MGIVTSPDYLRTSRGVVNQTIIVPKDTDNSLIPQQAENLAVVLGTIFSGRGAFSLKPDGSYFFQAEAGEARDLTFGYDLRNSSAFLINYAMANVYPSAWTLDQARLWEIGLANANFESKFRRIFYANAMPVDANNQHLLSWRVHILPFLGYSALYERFKLDEPWDSEHNLPLLAEMPDAFRSVGDDMDTNKTRFQVVADGIFPSSLGLLLNNVNRSGNVNRYDPITDGLSNTLFVVQSGADKAIEWTKPEDLTYDPSNPLGTLGTVGGYFNGVFGNGVVRTLPTNIGNAKFDAMVRINDGATVDPATETRRAQLLPDYPGDFVIPGHGHPNKSLRQIGLAMRNYESAHRRFPGATQDGFSWRVWILPHLEQSHLFEQFDFTQPCFCSACREH